VINGKIQKDGVISATCKNCPNKIQKGDMEANNEFPQTSHGDFSHPSVNQKFAEQNTNSKKKRKSSSKEASELVGSLSGSSEAKDNEDNTGPDYSSPSKKVQGDFFAARPLKLTQSKVNSFVLDYIMD